MTEEELAKIKNLAITNSETTGPYTPSRVVFSGGSGKQILIISPDGPIRLGEGATAEEAVAALVALASQQPVQTRSEKERTLKESMLEVLDDLLELSNVLESDHEYGRPVRMLRLIIDRINEPLQ